MLLHVFLQNHRAKQSLHNTDQTPLLNERIFRILLPVFFMVHLKASKDGLQGIKEGEFLDIT